MRSYCGRPLVSVIMTTYNGARYIRTALDSVLSQTYDNLQVIVVNDASEDCTPDILRSYTDPRLEVYDLPVNRHFPYAKNVGLKHVKGEYVAFLDDDDFWDQKKLEKQLEILESDKKYGACFTWASIVDENNAVRSCTDEDTQWLYNAFHTRLSRHRDYLIHFLTKGNCINNSSALVRREYVDKLGAQNLSLLQLQDFEYWIRLLSVTDAFMLCEELTYYRRVVGGQRISNVTKQSRCRTENEDVYICTHFFRSISDALFAELFHNDFQNPTAATPEELACEKAFLLKLAYCGSEPYKIALQNLLSAEETATVLYDKYQYTAKHFYEENLQKRYVNSSVLQEIQTLQTQLQCKEAHIHQLLQSERDLLYKNAAQSEQIQKLAYKLTCQTGTADTPQEPEAEP